MTASVSAKFPARQDHAEAQARAPNEIFCAICLIVLAMALIGFRSEIVRVYPRLATIYAGVGLPVNLRGLALENFQSITANEGSGTMLGVEGVIENLQPRSLPIPPIEIAIRDDQGRVLYSWQVAAPKRHLGAHESFTFRARLAEPPAAGTSVLVRFAPAPAFTLAALWRKAFSHL